MSLALSHHNRLKELRDSRPSKLPFWFKQEIPKPIVLERAQRLKAFKVHTVCQEARCPNLSSCFKDLRFTFMVLGDTCTRNCRFCTVKKTKNELGLDLEEPLRIARAVKELGLDYVVITSVTRDDLLDGGAEIFSRTIELIRKINPVRDTANSNNNTMVSNGIKIEVLIPDFQGRLLSLECLLAASPDVVAHNLETVSRLYPDLRPEADYALSLWVLKKIKELRPDLISKSSLMLGLGEKEAEVIEAMRDLRNSHCDCLTLGQYLAPSLRHYPVKEFISYKQFKRYEDLGLSLGFKAVVSGAKVRSSYQARELYQKVAYV